MVIYFGFKVVSSLVFEEIIKRFHQPEDFFRFQNGFKTVFWGKDLMCSPTQMTPSEWSLLCTVTHTNVYLTCNIHIIHSPRMVCPLSIFAVTSLRHVCFFSFLRLVPWFCLLHSSFACEAFISQLQLRLVPMLHPLSKRSWKPSSPLLLDTTVEIFQSSKTDEFFALHSTTGQHILHGIQLHRPHSTLGIIYRPLLSNDVFHHSRSNSVYVHGHDSSY